MDITRLLYSMLIYGVYKITKRANLLHDKENGWGFIYQHHPYLGKFENEPCVASILPKAFNFDLTPQTITTEESIASIYKLPQIDAGK